MFHRIIKTCIKNSGINTFFYQKSADRHYWNNMETVDLQPPKTIRGMTELNKNAFNKTVQIPKLVIPEEKLNKILPIMKKFFLKMERLKPVRSAPRNGGDHGDKEILLHPLAVKGWDSLPTDKLLELGIDKNNLQQDVIELNYDNWRADEIFKFILPEDQEGLTSYSRVGHIVHINLRDHLTPYKALIGNVLREKIPGCRTVVNKAQTIDNTYRNFQLELICGDPDYQVEVRESGVTFEFDFSKVYWNPRLSTEHERIVELIKPSDVLYDVFAGVGPFSIPAAKKKHCTVLANDLNPESFKWLNHNVKRNKCEGRIKTYNKDGKDFIIEDIKQDLISRYTSNRESNYNIHITMNLPAMAVEFLDAFQGLLRKEDIPDETKIIYPQVHVYSFAKGENTQKLVQDLVETNLGHKLTDNLVGIYFVRNVAPNKDMFRVSFYLTNEIIFSHRKKRSTFSPVPDCSPKKKCNRLADKSPV